MLLYFNIEEMFKLLVLLILLMVKVNNNFFFFVIVILILFVFGEGKLIFDFYLCVKLFLKK